MAGALLIKELQLSFFILFNIIFLSYIIYYFLELIEIRIIIFKSEILPTYSTQMFNKILLWNKMIVFKKMNNFIQIIYILIIFKIITPMKIMITILNLKKHK